MSPTGGAPWPRELGVVSNCWRTQLDAGVRLDALIAESVRRGWTTVELRQGCLGEYESGMESIPDVERLAALARRLPDAKLHLAISLPCLGGQPLERAPLFLAARSAAVSLARGSAPHLRLVDLDTRPPPSAPAISHDAGPQESQTCAASAAAQSLARLAESLHELGGHVSIEHAAQPWDWFAQAFADARRLLGADSNCLRLCFDPCNLLLTEPLARVAEIVERQPPREVSLIHVKQRRAGMIQSDVGPGDLAWPELLRSLRDAGHSAPVLFEVAPSRNVWNRLDAAARSVRAAG